MLWKRKLAIKKIISVILTISMVLSLSSLSVGAFMSSTDEENIIENFKRTEAEAIEHDRQIMYNDLVSQLEAQDALEYLEYFMFLIDDSIAAKYNTPAATASIMSIYAPYGGWELHDNTEISMETRYYSVLTTAELSKARAGSAILTLVGLLLTYLKPNAIVQVAGQIVTILGAASYSSALVNEMYWKDINLGIDSVMVTAAYDKLDLKTTTVIWKWSGVPYMKVNEKDLVAYGTFTKSEDEDLREAIKNGK